MSDKTEDFVTDLTHVAEGEGLDFLVERMLEPPDLHDQLDALSRDWNPRFERDASGAMRCLTDAELREKLLRQTRGGKLTLSALEERANHVAGTRCKGIVRLSVDEGRWKVTVRLRHKWWRWPWRWQNRRILRDALRGDVTVGVMLEIR